MVTDILDELYKHEEIELVLPRHEQGLIHEAEGYAKATGKVGVCIVTSGPGATNIITGLADAHYDSIPLVCITGQVPLGLIGNDAFQEVDIVGMTRSITKYGVTVRSRKDLGRILKMAFHIARTGKPGPVLIDLPKDIQTSAGPGEYPQSVSIRGYKPNENVHVGQLKKGYKLLKAAKKPLFLIGGGVNQRPDAGTGGEDESSCDHYRHGQGRRSYRPSVLHRQQRHAWEIRGQSCRRQL
jgi:acetolactate synthase-1/2/3 large subunit